MAHGFLRKNQTAIAVVVLLVGFVWIGWSTMGRLTFVQTALSGLTLGSLYFMVASGLTLIFGLMHVLNFAHGTMFMIGAYAGWQFYTNPTFIFGLLPLALALLAGLPAGRLLEPLVRRLSLPERPRKAVRAALILGAVAAGVAGVVGLDFLGLADTAMVAVTVGVNPLAEATAQEPLARFWLRPLLLAVASLLLAVANQRPGSREQILRPRKPWPQALALAGILAAAALACLFREPGALAVLKLNANLRFVLALAAGTVVGGALGAVVEATLIRPLYERRLYQVMVTLGLAFVLMELVQVLWDPLPYQMTRPPIFSQPGKAESLLAWFREGTVTVNILGVTFPSYRLFIIFLGLMMFILLAVLMRRSRLGIIIRAGVQDSEMVESLGINVRRVFTTVFVLGAGLAALGGIGAAPFVPVQPQMGDTFQVQAFITVVIGGFGSFTGAAIGALLLGLARAFGDFLALRYDLSPAISEASTVIIMAIVLLARPAGLFGKRE
jgi:branched-chain amino acid transport system permease protein